MALQVASRTTALVSVKYRRTRSRTRYMETDESSRAVAASAPISQPLTAHDTLSESDASLSSAFCRNGAMRSSVLRLSSLASSARIGCTRWRNSASFSFADKAFSCLATFSRRTSRTPYSWLICRTPCSISPATPSAGNFLSFSETSLCWPASRRSLNSASNCCAESCTMERNEGANCCFKSG